MRLPRPFYQLPLLFDTARLQAEVSALPDAAWAPHPDGIAGNSAARLITTGGAETDAHVGHMLPTPWLATMPYLRQLLAGFGVVWSRSRLMRLAPGVGVPEHADINLHWHTRVRIHIPIFTTPDVRFHCDGEAVHMAAGEAWIFDNWRRHHVENPSSADRIHLVADTSGTAEFWQLALGQHPPRQQWPLIGWQPDLDAPLLTEADQRLPVMPAAEAQWLIEDLIDEIDPTKAPQQAARLQMVLDGFLRDWRQLCALHGPSGRGLPDFAALARALREAAAPLGQGLTLRSNGADALLVLEKRILQHMVTPQL
jgi:hypothetical protein